MKQALFIFTAEFKADMHKLEAEYQRKANVIKQTYLEGLKSALKTLIKKHDADPLEVANLSAMINDIQASVIQLTGMI